MTSRSCYRMRGSLYKYDVIYSVSPMVKLLLTEHCISFRYLKKRLKMLQSTKVTRVDHGRPTAIVCILAVALRLIIPTIKLIVLVVMPIRRFGYLMIYLPVLLVATIFSVIQLYCLHREIKQPSLWFRDWLCRVFTLYSLYFWILLYPYAALHVWVYYRGTPYGNLYTFGTICDIAETIMCLVVQSLIFRILFRPMHVSEEKTSLPNQYAVVQVTQSKTPFSNIEKQDHLCTGEQRMDGVFCNKNNSFYVVGLFFYVVYVLACVILAYCMLFPHPYTM